MNVQSGLVDNLKVSAQLEIQGHKNMWVNAAPCLAAAMTCLCLAELASKHSAEIVAKITSQSLYCGVALFVVGTAYKFWDSLEKERATIEGKKIEYVRLPKNDFDRLHSEIIRLRQEVEFVKIIDVKYQINTIPESSTA